MTKSERLERFKDYSARSPRDLADLMCQADEAIERRQNEIAALKAALRAIEVTAKHAQAASRKSEAAVTAVFDANDRAFREIELGARHALRRSHA